MTLGFICVMVHRSTPNRCCFLQRNQLQFAFFKESPKRYLLMLVGSYPPVVKNHTIFNTWLQGPPLKSLWIVASLVNVSPLGSESLNRCCFLQENQFQFAIIKKCWAVWINAKFEGSHGHAREVENRKSHSFFSSTQTQHKHHGVRPQNRIGS